MFTKKLITPKDLIVKEQETMNWNHESWNLIKLVYNKTVSLTQLTD